VGEKGKEERWAVMKQGSATVLLAWTNFVEIFSSSNCRMQTTSISGVRSSYSD
jgi:hypothetical protein